MEESNPQHEEDIVEFCNVTGLPAQAAHGYLSQNDWNLRAAITEYYHSIDPSSGDEDDDVPAPENGPAAAAHNTILKQPSAPSSSSAASAAHPPQPKEPKKRFGTLKDLQNDGGSGGHGHGHGHEDDDEKDTEYFAGGDKSGLAVQDRGSGSRDQIQRLLNMARRNGAPPAAEQPQQSRFAGQGQTLGGEGEESRIIPDPSASTRRLPPMAERVLHLWADGFSVDDGPLYRYDDPANARTLEMINRGSAPLDIMNVADGQAVDVKLDTHRDENYVQPKKTWKPFSGGGQRLGSPTLDTASSPNAVANTVSSSAPMTATRSASSTPSTGVDEAQPTLTLQIRLADGTRLPSRFNTTHTVADVYSFVNRASPTSNTRPYTLATTFPTKELSDHDQVLGDMAEFKRGGVLVQKWS